MELTFSKSSNGYVADYLATTHFNLHIESSGKVMLYKRTSGEYGDLIASISSSVVDVDVAVNFPVIYTIVLTKIPSSVTITTADGEVINAVIPEESSGDIPSGYAEFITADDMVFTASDGAFYVKL